MKFIRDIISERANPDAPEPGLALPVPPRPATPNASEHPAEAGPSDRTMTRLPQDLPIDDNDIFDRLLRDETEAEPAIADEIPDQPSDEIHLIDPAKDDIGNEDEGRNPTPSPVAPLTLRAEERVAPDIKNPTDPEDSIAALIPPSLQDHARAPVNPPTDHPPRPSSVDMASSASRTAAPDPDARQTGIVAVPSPATGRSGRAANRVKTRLLGFGSTEDPMRDPFRDATPAQVGTQVSFPVGWLVVIAGPGRGTAFSLQTGVSQLGRGEDQAIRLDFGDTAISRSNHAAIAYDAERGGFYLGHGGKANMVRLNDRPVLSTEELPSGAIIRIGETSLRFVAFCDAEFSWAEDGADPHGLPS